MRIEAGDPSLQPRADRPQDLAELDEAPKLGGEGRFDFSVGLVKMRSSSLYGY